MQTNGTLNGIDDKHQMIGLKRQNYEQRDDSPTKSIYLGYNSPQNGSIGSLPLWSIPPLLPSMPSNIGAFFSKIPSVPVPYCAYEGFDHDNILLNNNGSNLKSGTSQKSKGDDRVTTFDEIPAIDVKVEVPGGQEEGVHEEKHSPLNQTLRLEDGVVALGFEHHRGAEKCSKSWLIRGIV